MYMLYIAYVYGRDDCIRMIYIDGGIVGGVGVNVLYSAAFGFHSTKVKNILYKKWCKV